ncbi:uncharacterized protein NEMAJ01_2356 [Nematocida major]|uniref:uncharacterized protein n=1 Tax=Nematocida major TaxID=1912982 RepID=UPI002007BC0D|nr:uncharacterized protein NEMAJ01_2356 [Nematocida major]KAH9387460.1 hypothetical protein NEMAJ01_2356 [Nematocida major]
MLLAARNVAVCMKMAQKSALANLETAAGRDDVIVNPQWVGHPMHIFHLNALEYVQNMRTYSSELDTKFSLVLDGSQAERAEKETYTYTREPLKDTPHLPSSIHRSMETLRTGEYGLKYHRALLHMFPSLKNKWLIIRVKQPRSFTRFLQKSCKATEEAHYVLAALVLLSEGVDVPIKTAGKRVILKKRRDSNDVLVDARLKTEGEGSERQLSETWQAVNFFKRYRGTQNATKHVRRV